MCVQVVTPDQSSKIYQALKEKGLPVALVEYEGEQHGFRKVNSFFDHFACTTTSMVIVIMKKHIYNWLTGREHQIHTGATNGVLCPSRRRVPSCR